MLAVRIHRFGTDALRVEDVPEPVPERGQVLLRVRACSLNFRDWLILRGEYNPSYPLPLTLGSDAVGEVVAFGPDTDPGGLSLGDRVCPLLAQGWFDGDPRRSTLRHTLGGPLAGVFAELVVARVDSVVRIPEAIDDLQAACLPCAALTAYSALRVLDRVGPGHSLLTLGSGGVSVSAIAIGRAVGARVIATTRRPEKEARLLELGAETVVSSSAPGWGKRVRELAGGEGVDHVIEVGGAGTLDESLAAVRPGGTISLIGVLSSQPGKAPNLTPLIMRNVRLQGVVVGHLRGFQELVALAARASLKVPIHRVYPLAAAADAFDRLVTGEHVGKICFELPR
jgi:NADPH:quinone reductase-like Zn-dependent oxidoreductase